MDFPSANLVIDCSRVGVWLGLYNGEGVVFEVHKEDAKGSELNEILANLELDSVKNVLVALGPGSFTGIRAGIAFAEGLCFSGRRNLYGVSTLRALAEAENLPRVILRARANFYYVRENGREELLKFDTAPETHENVPISHFARLIPSLAPSRTQKANYMINPYEKNAARL